MSHLWIAQTTVAHLADAESLAKSAIEQNLAACVQLDPGVTSIFRWEGQLEEDVEIRLNFKTTAARLPALKAFIHEEHPYDTPEWVAWPVGDTSAAYLSWAEGRVSDVED